MAKNNIQSYPLVLATCIETGNMPPAYIGQKMAFFTKGRRGTLGASWLDSKVEGLLPKEVTGGCTLQKIRGPEQSWARILLEVYGPQRELILLGAGHISKKLAQVGNFLNYKVTVVDNRPEYAVPQDFYPDARVICCPYSKVDKYVAFGDHTSVVVATYGHLHDLECLEVVLKYNLPYIGVVGSQHRRALLEENLGTANIPPDKVKGIHMPVGLDIGAGTPAEVALSVGAEILARRRRRPGTSLSAERAPGGPGEKGNTPLGEDPDIELLQQARRFQREGKAGVLATVVGASVSTPRKSGAKMLILEDGTVTGTIGGGLVEANVMAEARKIIAQPRLVLKKFSLRPGPEQDAMLCGGEMEVFLEPLSALGTLLREEDWSNAESS